MSHTGDMGNVNDLKQAQQTNGMLVKIIKGYLESFYSQESPTSLHTKVLINNSIQNTKVHKHNINISHEVTVHLQITSPNTVS